MGYVKWTIYGLLALLAAGFFHYTLPQHDVVRIVNTFEEQHTLKGWRRIFWSTPDDTATDVEQRYVQFIQTVDPDGDIMVYRNEDTGWGWPPYFKFDTSNLYTEAADLVSSKDAPQWVVLKHYGWRNEIWSIFPNAISVRPVDSADQRIIPWLNIAILTVLFALFWAIRVRWVRFWDRRVDPALESVGDSVHEGGSWLRRLFGGR